MCAGETGEAKKPESHYVLLALEQGYQQCSVCCQQIPPDGIRHFVILGNKVNGRSAGEFRFIELLIRAPEIQQRYEMWLLEQTAENEAEGIVRTPGPVVEEMGGSDDSDDEGDDSDADSQPQGDMDDPGGESGQNGIINYPALHHSAISHTVYATNAMARVRCAATRGHTRFARQADQHHGRQ